MESSDGLCFGPFRLGLAHEQLWREDQPIPLRPKTFAVLRHLATHTGQLVTQEELLETVWAKTIVTDTVLRSCIRELRSVLGDDARQPRYIATVHRRGYRFLPPISTQPAPSSRFQVQRMQGREASPQCGTGNGERGTSLVGREAELAHLHERLAQALNGERQVLFVTGEPGIGKTTLLDAFLRQLSDQDFWIGYGHCIEQYGEGEAYMPILEALGQLCRAPGGERLILLLDQHAPTWLVQMPTLLSVAHLEALQRKVEGSTRERMLREMGDAISTLTAEQPLILRLEDLHWSDSSTLELIALLARRQEQARLLVLGSYRPMDVVAKGHPLLTIKRELHLHGLCGELSLPLLTEEAVAEYLMACASFMVAPHGSGDGKRSTFSSPSGVTSPQHLARVIHQRTEGNPLFMVTLVEHLVSEGVVEAIQGAWRIRGEIGVLANQVPESLRQWLAQQIERLSAIERGLLEVASVVGEEFAVAAVAAGLDQPIENVETTCAELAREKRLIRSADIQEWPDGTLAGCYMFQHALYPEVLYERLSDARRIHLHRRIGERKEAAYGVQASAIAAELAVHFELGRDYAKALQYYQHATKNARQQSAHAEAVYHATKGLALLALLPASPEQSQQELTLQLTLGEVLTVVHGFGTLEVARAFARGRELCRQLGETPQIFRTLIGLWAHAVERAELTTAHELATQLLRLAPTLQAPRFAVWAHFALGLTLYYQGRQGAAREHLEQSLAYYESQPSMSLQYDAGVLSCAHLGPVLWLLGYPEQARQRSQEALRRARELGQPYNLVYALDLALVTNWLLEEWTTVQQHQQELQAIAEENNFASYLALAKVSGGALSAEHHDPAAGIVHMRQSLAAWRATGAVSPQPSYLALLAEAYGRAGHPEDGLAVLEECLVEEQRTGGRFFAAELYRLKGELTLQKYKK